MRAGNIAIIIFLVPYISVASALFPTDTIAGIAEGQGTDFHVTESDYMPIGLHSTEAVKLRLESVPNVITMRIKPASASATSTGITLTGLVPDTPYFKYEDNYHNLTPILSDENGAYAYTQDISTSHLVFIQPERSTKFIVNDATGGDCALLGTWDLTTLTCTLTADMTETVQIDSDGITLDGGGHTTKGSQTGSGVYLDAKSGVTIKNLVIKDFSYGIFLNASSQGVMVGNSISQTRGGIVFDDSSFNTVDTNNFLNNLQAIVFFSSDNNTVRHNAVSIDISSPNRHQAIVFFDSSHNLLDGNSITMNNDARSRVHQGIVFFNAHATTVVNNTLSRIHKALLLFDSSDITLYRNNFINNGTHAIDFSDAPNTFNLSQPEGGNYWDTFDDSAGGCDDADLDSFCDAAYVFKGGQDALPWTTQNGWEGPPDPCASGGCVSNVLFLPGIEGSRLYEGTGCGKSAEEKLWEPLGDSIIKILRGAGDNKVKSLFLDEAGESVCSDIYAKADDIIDSVGGSTIYKSFIDEMNELTTDDIITAWKPVAYDWRLSLPDLLNNGTERDGKIFYAEGNKSATSTPYIEQTLRLLAASSKTKKVNIVAHSNGGLVAKALLDKLGGETAKSLVDKVIMVGAPQSGAPVAIGALLYGLDQGISWHGIPILHSAVARELAQNAPMAYHLLPSEDYLESTAGDRAHPVIRFSGDGYAKEKSAYGPTVANRVALADFLLAKEGGREKPKPSDVHSAEILNSSLIEYANSQHATLDAWAPPAGIEVSQIAGWGADTIAGIDFYTAPFSILSLFGSRRNYRPLFVEDGDGTVPVPSALMMASSTSVKRYWVNLDSYRKETSTKRSHRDLFEIPSLQDFIKNIIQNSTSTIPSFISSSQPSPLTDNKKLIFFLHTSPVIQASTTPKSVKPKVKVVPKVKIKTNPSSDKDKVTGVNEDDSITEDIPDSAYGEFGDVQYIIVPEDGLYELTFHGQGSDSSESAGGGVGDDNESDNEVLVSLDIQEISAGIITASTTIANIPMTASSTATLTISRGIDTASALVVDEDGDGKNIITVTPVIGEVVNYEPPASETKAASESVSEQTLASEAQSASVSQSESSSVVSSSHIVSSTGSHPIPNDETASQSNSPSVVSSSHIVSSAGSVSIPHIAPIVAVAAVNAFAPVVVPVPNPIIRDVPRPVAPAKPLKIVSKPPTIVTTSPKPKKAAVDIPQTASVYEAVSEQPLLLRLVEMLYTALYRFWIMLKNFFI